MTGFRNVYLTFYLLIIYYFCTCLVRDEGGERLQRSVGVVEASHGFGPLEQQDVGHCHRPKPRGEAGGRWVTQDVQMMIEFLIFI